MPEINWQNSAARHAAYGRAIADPFACIPNASDDEYSGTILETSAERERRAAELSLLAAKDGD